MFSNMPIMLSRFTPGVATAEVDIQNVFQGYMEGTTNMAGGQVGTGSGFDSRNTGNNYTIDGAQNNGFGRRIASSPNADQIEEVRVETSNFDAGTVTGSLILEFLSAVRALPWGPRSRALPGGPWGHCTGRGPCGREWR